MATTRDVPNSWHSMFGDVSKLVRFSLYGALGCLAGAVLGEWMFHVGGSAQPTQFVTLLIDCSGSMHQGHFPWETNGNKLEEVKSAATAFVERHCSDSNLIAVIGFGGRVHRASPLTSNLGQLQRAISGLSDGGSTAMHHGLVIAEEEVLDIPGSSKPPGALHNILLFTDGQPDDQFAALEAALQCREKKIKVFAIGTGDADVDFLAQITGDSSLVFDATTGSFADSFRQAENAIYGGSLVQSTGSELGGFGALLLNSLWTALLAIGVSLALIAGQNLYLQRPILSRQEALLCLGYGFAAGAIAGLVGQAFYALVYQAMGDEGGVARLFMGAARIVGWAVLGALVGRGLATFVPNLDPSRVWVGGALGGMTAAIVYQAVNFTGLMVSRFATPSAATVADVLARFLGVTVLGASIGMMIAIIEAACRRVWLEIQYGEKEFAKVNLGDTPVRIGSDTRVCPVYARGARPLACEYLFKDGKILFRDFATEISAVVAPGDQREVGAVRVTVCASSQDAPIETRSAPTVVSAPPPRRPQFSATVAGPTPPTAGQSSSSPGLRSTTAATEPKSQDQLLQQSAAPSGNEEKQVATPPLRSNGRPGQPTSSDDLQSCATSNDCPSDDLPTGGGPRIAAPPPRRRPTTGNS